MRTAARRRAGNQQGQIQVVGRRDGLHLRRAGWLLEHCHPLMTSLLPSTLAPTSRRLPQFLRHPPMTARVLQQRTWHCQTQQCFSCVLSLRFFSLLSLSSPFFLYFSGNIAQQLLSLSLLLSVFLLLTVFLFALACFKILIREKRTGIRPLISTSMGF